MLAAWPVPSRRFCSSPAACRAPTHLRDPSPVPPPLESCLRPRGVPSRAPMPAPGVRGLLLALRGLPCPERQTSRGQTHAPISPVFSPGHGETCFCWVAGYTRTEFTQPPKPHETALLSHSRVRPQVLPRLAGKEPGRRAQAVSSGLPRGRARGSLRPYHLGPRWGS